MSDINFDNEQKYLDKTLDVIRSEIKELEQNCESKIEEVKSLSKYHWESQSEMDDIEFAESRNGINHTAILTNNQISRLRKLRKALENPYFGKIKIEFDQDDQEDFYIGITSILKNNDLIVNDWRSPIATLFYNSKLGNTKYKAPAGIISCNLKQREQIKIKNSKIKRIIDSDIHLSDDELQEVLNETSNGKMKNIITTIQEEQNDIIRNVTDSKIIVQGCAGSGKTSVALHRLSYLLYNDEKTKSENMLIFSPSDTFSSYISNVLPDLGDNNVAETTFSDFANAFVKRFDKIESFTEFISRYYDGKNTKEQDELNKFKFKNDFKIALDMFIKNFVNSYRFKDDVRVMNYNISKDYLNKFLDNDTTSSLQEKISIVTEEVCSLYKKVPNIDKKYIRNIIAKELIKPSFDPRATYNKFLQSDEFKKLYGKAGNKLNKNLLEYPDLIGMLYLNFEFMGYPKNNLIHHLVVDEVQDYTPLQLEIINKIFYGASITVLGDANQTINPYHKYDSLEDMKKIFGINSKYVELNKAYRSSPEIMEYIKNILEDDKINPVRVSMNNPVKIKEVDKDSIFTELVKDIKELKEKGFNRICVITKSSKESLAIYEGLKDTELNVDALSVNNDKRDCYVSPSYIAKGLEFDAVINYNDMYNPYEKEDKYLYYVACTRAQHNLVVYNEPKELVKER